ncbi:MAG: hypothetical protein BGO49_27525 [Planctomycetales bacterium 71-10]|nr:MAG: hypothetical protein BGO49_27525 [Planctomycetales bacterium 71-10]
MRYSLELLVRGEESIVVHYRKAASHWREIWSRPESGSLSSLASLLTSEQSWFEKNCGGRWVGQEVMVVSGLVGLYETESGFNGGLPRARLLYDAFQSSYCSVEVKSIAEEVARSYDLLDASRV